MFEKIPAEIAACSPSLSYRASGRLLHPYANTCEQSKCLEYGEWLWDSGSGHQGPQRCLLHPGCFQSTEVWPAGQGGGLFPSALQGCCMRLGEPQCKTDTNLLECVQRRVRDGAPLSEHRLRWFREQKDLGRPYCGLPVLRGVLKRRS